MQYLSFGLAPRIHLRDKDASVKVNATSNAKTKGLPFTPFKGHSSHLQIQVEYTYHLLYMKQYKITMIIPKYMYNLPLT